MVSLRIGAGAHRGLVREENQDRISRIPSPFGELFIVADGMGGHEGGATAAQMLIDGLGEHLRALPSETPPDEALRLAAQRAHSEIYRRAQGDRSLAQMGATAVLALVRGNQAWIAHAGDSRAYLWRGGQLRQLTRDHTLVQRMVDRQMLDEEEARHHPDANVVTRAFGQAPEVEIEVAAPLELRAGDRLLLCSDGLSGYVEDAAIAQVLATDGDAQATTNALIDLALRTGGEDNISVQLLAVEAEKAPAVAPRPVAVAAETRPTPSVERTPEKAPRRGVSGFLLLLPLILVAALAGVLLPWRSWLAGEQSPEPAAQNPADRTDPTDLSGPTGPADQTDPYGAAGTLPLGTDLVAPALPEPAPAAAPQVPRLTVLSPAGARVPAIKQRVLRAYPGNWSSPVSLDARLAGALVPGRVYFRPGFAPAAAELARELGSSAAPWPESLAGEHPEADLLVIYPSRPAPGGTP